MDGSCHDPRNPKRALSFTPYTSIVYQHYYDCKFLLNYLWFFLIIYVKNLFTSAIYVPRLAAKNNMKLPGARMLIKMFFDDCKPYDIFYDFAPSMGGVMFGQIMTHDVTEKPIPQVKSGGPGINCCTTNGVTVQPKSLLHPFCDPIRVSKSDDFYGPYNVTCLNFVRTQTAINNDCKLTSRIQV